MAVSGSPSPESARPLAGLETRVHLLPADLRLPLAEALAQRGMVSEAQDILQALLATGEWAPDDLRMAMARIYVGMGDFCRAAGELRTSAGCSNRPLVRAFAAYLEVMAHSGNAADECGMAVASVHLENARQWTGQVLTVLDDLSLENGSGDDAEVIALCVHSCLLSGTDEGADTTGERLRLLLDKARVTHVETGYALLMYARRRLDQGCQSAAEQALDIAWELIIPPQATARSCFP
ncbi:hypothetical protein ACFSC4_24875 [Deinococcus malanensis]|uniref:hypothetical protein n=1 Tax=Deinococcus malanensis TaxID=1706855 RepID=UPI003635A0B7